MERHEARLMVRLLCACIAVGGTFGAAQAVAEEAGAEQEELPIENLFVVVTAQKRAENLQETPIAITALSESDIQNRGVSSLVDLHVAVPGVAGYEAPSSRGNVAFNIRGISSGNPNSVSADPANALYVDGVYLGKAVGNGVDALDLERIEVLRGPQGTLYGRNSTGGAINLITRKPGAELGAGVKATAGDYGYQAFSGRIDLPLADQFNVAVSGYSRERDPLYDNTRPGGAGFENLDRHGLRLAAFFDATDSFSIDYAFSLDELDENAQALDVVGFNPARRRRARCRRIPRPRRHPEHGPHAGGRAVAGVPAVPGAGVRDAAGATARPVDDRLPGVRRRATVRRVLPAEAGRQRCRPGVGQQGDGPHPDVDPGCRRAGRLR